VPRRERACFRYFELFGRFCDGIFQFFGNSGIRAHNIETIPFNNIGLKFLRQKGTDGKAGLRPCFVLGLVQGLGKFGIIVFTIQWIGYGGKPIVSRKKKILPENDGLAIGKRAHQAGAMFWHTGKIGKIFRSNFQISVFRSLSYSSLRQATRLRRCLHIRFPADVKKIIRQKAWFCFAVDARKPANWQRTRPAAAFRPLDHSRRLTRRAGLEIRRKKLSEGSF
jgi:hypothetical protein